MRRIIFPLLVVLFVAALSALPAIAAPSAPDGASHLRAQDGSETTTVLHPVNNGNGTQPAQQVGDITCTSYVDYPHVSSSSGGTRVNNHIVTDCTAPVDDIEHVNSLYRDWDGPISGEFGQGEFTSHLESHVSAECISGNHFYQERSSVYVYKAGYVTDYPTIYIGNEAWVNCGF